MTESSQTMGNRRQIEPGASQPAGSRQARHLKRFAILAIGMVALFVVAPYALRGLGNYLIVYDPLEQADAVVVLAGERPRSIFAEQLIAHRYANWLITTKEFMRGDVIAEGVAESRVLLVPDPNAVMSTYDEARVVRELAQEREMHSLIVVTSPYHTRRAQLIFDDVFADSSISFTMQPVRQHWYSSDTWWHSVEGMQRTGSEYFKLAFYFVGGYQLLDGTNT
jgi:uncharacterized SAM-binding protein YcdF (DUF218 family)